MAISEIIEPIYQVEITQENELVLVLKSGGEPHYQYIYREAAGVYWDSVRGGFKSTEQNEWPFSKWFEHIASVVFSGLGVNIHLAQEVEWINVPEDVQRAIESLSAAKIERD